MRKKHGNKKLNPLIVFCITMLLSVAAISPFTSRSPGLLLCLLISTLAAIISFLLNKLNKNKDTSDTNNQSDSVLHSPEANRISEDDKYSPDVKAILTEGNRALSEMGRLYMSIKNPDVRLKINELMRITDKISQDAVADPSDIPQIKKFMNYYLPTTIKLLNNYDRMSSQGIEGENLDKTMKNILDMLDTAIEAYKKQLDSLFQNQALDVETDIEVLSKMLAREGLSGGNDFKL